MDKEREKVRQESRVLEQLWERSGLLVVLSRGSESLNLTSSSSLCQGHDLILSLTWMTESLTGLTVSRSEACGWPTITQKPQMQQFGLGKCRSRERHTRGKCAQTCCWTEHWCKANQPDQRPILAQSRYTDKSIYISMAQPAGDSQEQRITDLEMIACSSGLLCLWWVDNMLSVCSKGRALSS